MTGFEPSKATRERLSRRWRVSLIFPALVFGAQLLLQLWASGSSVVVAVTVLGAAVLAAVPITALILGWMQRADRALRRDDDTALYVGSGTVYVDQLTDCAELRDAVAQIRRPVLRVSTLGQGFVSGVVRLDAMALSWRPGRLARRLRAESWDLPVGRMRSLELSPMPVRVGRRGTATLILTSGQAIDLVLNDRDLFAEAWRRTRIAGASDAPKGA